jgi:predicted DCC family thiol-disulfide oxidoreductase YuxK
MSQGVTISESVLSDQMGDRALMLYDGLCGLCNNAVRWVIQHDRADRFRFAPQQSALAAEILSRSGIDSESMLKNNSVYLVFDPGSEHQRLLTRSDVTVNILLLLGGRWRVFGYLLRGAPSFARHAAYGIFARNRYRISDRYDVCPVPADVDRTKFIG